MAFKRFAKALVTEPGVEFDRWVEEIRKQHEGAVSKDYVGRIAKTVLRKCDPKQFLLSHATIVASVDAYAPKGVKTGRYMNHGVQIDVKYPDFKIKPECHDIINNNGDAWERSLLLNTYRTFIGAANYVEHIQLPELSKGFIVDAVARDLGKTCYIDILVATDRKHQKLVQDILAGSISAMSMGCISLFTICTKCGNVAVDDSMICPCIAFEGKGTKYVDEEGIEHPISELIGHVSAPNSNQFIEASWVRNPAFRGAVRRQILNPDMDNVAAQLSSSGAIYEIRRDSIDLDGLKKVASKRLGAEDVPPPVDDLEDSLPSDDALPDSAPPDAPPDDSAPPDDAPPDEGLSDDSPNAGKDESIDELLDKAQEQILQILVDKLGKKLEPKPEDVGVVTPTVPTIDSGNENFVGAAQFDRQLKKVFPNNTKLTKWASRAYRIIHEGGMKSIQAARMKPRDLVIYSWIEDRVKLHNYNSDLYKTVISVGPLKSYPSKQSYLAACKMRLKRDMSESDKSFLIWKGRIASVA
jgi:hypothetical protein